MIHWNQLPRPLRVTGAMSGIGWVLLMAGCSSSDAMADGAVSSETSEASTATAEPAEATSEASASTESAEQNETSSDYADGTYTADGSYQTPGGVESVSVEITLEDDIVTDVEVSGEAANAESEQYRSAFIGGISDEVVGKSIDELAVDRVAGSSLTSSGFNAALAQILEEASA